MESVSMMYQKLNTNSNSMGDCSSVHAILETNLHLLDFSLHKCHIKFVIILQQMILSF